jgi:hypothetical protein
MTIKKTDFISSFSATVSQSASDNLTRSEQFASQYEETKDTDVKRAQQRSATHAKYDSKLSELSSDALAVCYTFKLNAESIVNQSRELKKRLMSALNAIAATDKNKLDKALLNALTVIVVNNAESISIDALQRAMSHETNTQANYFKRFCLFLDVADYEKSTQTMTFKTDSALYKRMIALFD